MYRYIVFDVDGTLIDTEKAGVAALQKLLEEETGKKVAEEDLAFTVGIPGRTALEILGISRIDAALAKWHEYMKDNCYFYFIQPYEGIEDLLLELSDRSIKTGVVTSRSRMELMCDAIFHRLSAYFDPIICADDTIMHKPHPEPIQKLLSMVGASPEEVLYIGDTAYDAQCAHDSGVDFALVLWNGKTDNGIHAEYKLQTPLDLLKKLA